jgi:hypothetical protein
VGDLVIAHHVGENYYNAKVIAYDVSSHEYTVKWDDGDTSATCQPFERVSLDRTPDENDVGVGTIVLFTQGERCARTCKRARHAAACELLQPSPFSPPSLLGARAGARMRRSVRDTALRSTRAGSGKELIRGLSEPSPLFAPAGTYHYTTSEGVRRENLDRYHEGVITEIRRNGDKRLYVGRHTKSEDDGKILGYSGYEVSWERELSQLRVCGNLMAAISGDNDESDDD